MKNKSTRSPTNPLSSSPPTYDFSSLLDYGEMTPSLDSSSSALDSSNSLQFSSLMSSFKSPNYDVLKRRSSSSSTRPASFDRCNQCQFCQKTFSGPNRNSHLHRHLMIHTGEKPHVCPHCPHRTSRAENLRLHLKLKHPEIYLTSRGVDEHVANQLKYLGFNK